MKLGTKILFLVVMSIILLGSVKAEVSLWQNQLMNGLSSGSINLNSTVQDHIFYQFDDTSLNDVGRNKPISLRLEYSIPALPYASTSSTVDWCNVTLRHFKNIYNDDGNRINVTMEMQSYYYSSSPATLGEINLDMRSDDVLSGDIYCHYTNVSALYESTIPVGIWNTYLPSYQCSGCKDYSYEVLTNELDTLDSRLSDQTQIYSSIQTFADYNFQVWLIIKWIVAIAFFIIAIYLIFYSMYFVYRTFKQIEGEI